MSTNAILSEEKNNLESIIQVNSLIAKVAKLQDEK